MIDLDKIRSIVPNGMSEYIGIPIIRGNQSKRAPSHPYGTYNITTIAAANNGTWQQHEDGVDRLLVRSTWSFTFITDDWLQSIMYASNAREWLTHTGRVLLADNGITVQSVTDITNRDNILTVEYERKNGFDVVFYIYDEAANPSSQTGYIESVSLAPDIKT